jgi:hypothetical protein
MKSFSLSVHWVSCEDLFGSFFFIAPPSSAKVLKGPDRPDLIGPRVVQISRSKLGYNLLQVLKNLNLLLNMSNQYKILMRPLRRSASYFVSPNSNPNCINAGNAVQMFLFRDRLYALPKVKRTGNVVFWRIFPLDSRALYKSVSCRLKETVSRDFRLLVFFMNQFPPSP